MKRRDDTTVTLSGATTVVQLKAHLYDKSYNLRCGATGLTNEMRIGGL